MMGKAAAAVAKKKGQRSSRIQRPPRPDPAPSRPPPSPPPSDSSRSLRSRRRRLSIADYDEESEEEERGRRKLKLVLNLPLLPTCREELSLSSPSIHRTFKPTPHTAAVAAHVPPSASTSSPSASATSFSSLVDEDSAKPLKKRRINGYDDGLGSDGSGHQKERKKYGLSRSKGSVYATSPGLPKGTPLPERKTLESILDKLQKKDIYRVFAHPVDPEELPDYYDLIDHPMDFGTIRKKLASNAYRSLEQFEDDVFLICSNAMHYNAPDTVYFRQARAIQDMARNKFQILRAEAKSVETERRSAEKIKFSSIEKKSLQKSLCRAEQKPLGSDISSRATLSSAGNTRTGLVKVQANGVENRATANGLVDGNFSLGEGKSEKADLLYRHSSLGESKSEKSRLVDGHPSLGESESVKADLVDGNSSLGESKSVKAGLVGGNSSLGESKSVKAGLVNGNSALGDSKSVKAGLVDGNSSLSESKSVKAGSVDGNSSLGESKSEKAGLVDGNSCKSEKAGLVDGNSFLGDSKLEKAGLVDGNSSLGEGKSEKADELSVKCSPSKVVQKPFLVDINRRATYNKSEHQQTIESDSVFDVFESETKQLNDVGLHAENSYARSLAHFAASLGPVGWNIASKAIERALPPGMKFGPGWVGEYEPLPTPVLSLESRTQQLLRNNSDLKHRITSRNDTESEERLKAAQNGDSKVMQLGHKSQVITEMPHGASNPAEGTLFRRTTAGKQGFHGVSSETQPKTTNRMLRQHKDVPEQLRVCDSSSTLRRTGCRSEAPNQGLFGHSEETQPRIMSTMLQHQNNQVTIDFARSYSNASEQQARVSNSSSVSSIPAETALRRTEFHSEARNQGSFGFPTETQPRIINTMFPPQKDQVAIDFTKACYSVPEKARGCNSSPVSSIPVETWKQGWFGVPAEPSISNVLHQRKDRVAIDLAKASNNIAEPKSHSEAQKQQGWFGVSAETQRRISNAAPQHHKDQVPVNFARAYNNLSEQFRVCNSSSGGRTDCCSEDANPGMISRNSNQLQPEPRKQAAAVTSQSGSDALGLTVGGSRNNGGYFVTRGSNEQAIDFRLMGLGLTGIVPGQPNNSNAGVYTVKQGMMPHIAQPRRDDTNARPWMSYGPECGSIDAMADPKTGLGSFHNSGWRAPATSAMVHGDSRIFPQPMPPVAEESDGQKGVVFYPQLVATDLSRFRGRTPWQGLVPHSQPRQKKDMLPPDLNIGFQPPVSPARPSSGVLVDSQQPDLALQL